jgi:hypothetical protein
MLPIQAKIRELYSCDIEKITAGYEQIPKNQRRRITTSPIPIPAAPITSVGSTGDASVGVALGHGVGTFSVDFLIVVAVFTGVAVAAVVATVVSSLSGSSVA